MSYRKKHITPKIRNLRPRKNILKMRLFWYAVFIMLLLSIIVYFILFDSRFKVSSIEISGNDKIKSADIEGLILLKASGRIFLINRNILAGKILNKFPIIKTAEIQKKFPDSIIIKVQERKPFAVFCQKNSMSTEACFFIDDNGVIFEPIERVSKDAVVITMEATSKEFFVGENAISKNMIGIVSNVQDTLKNNFQIDIKEVFVSNPLIIKTSENWQMYLDPDSDITLQITKMNALLTDKIPLSARKNMQYLYLQYKDRAYYK